jgi:hypothetical protein
MDARSSKTARALRWPLVLFGTLMFATACRSRGPDAEALATGMKAKMTLPVAVDGETRLDDVRALSKTELGYFLTLTKTTRATLDPNLGKLLETNLRGGACQNANYQKLLAAGISVSIAYRTEDQADVVRVVIAPKDCGH